jgi:hypothetical protein
MTHPPGRTWAARGQCRHPQCRGAMRRAVYKHAPEQLGAAQAKNAAEDERLDAVRVLLRVRQREGGPPRPAKHDPLVHAARAPVSERSCSGQGGRGVATDPTCLRTVSISSTRSHVVFSCGVTREVQCGRHMVCVCVCVCVCEGHGAAGPRGGRWGWTCRRRAGRAAQRGTPPGQSTAGRSAQSRRLGRREGRRQACRPCNPPPHSS